MSSLSVVIPRYQPGIEFENTLASVLRYRLARHQVVVVMPADQFDDYGLGHEARFVACEGQQSCAAFLKAALKEVTGEAVFVLQPRIEVASQWFAPAMRALSDSSVASVSLAVTSTSSRGLKRTFGLRFQSGARVGHVEESRAQVVGPSPYASAYRSESLKQLLCFIDPLDDFLYGLEFALAARSVGLRCETTEEAGITVAGPLPMTLLGGYRSGLFAARLAERYPVVRRSGLAKFAGWFRKAADFATPAQWSCLLGQFQARRFRQEDTEYATRLTKFLAGDGSRDDRSPVAVRKAG